jgi:hypothetical protein
MFKRFQALGKAIKSVTPNVPKTKLEKAKSKLAIAKQKTKASEAKLKQTQFELKNKQPLTFKTQTGKSESNKERYKRIQKENTKAIKGMIDDAFKKPREKKMGGGMMGRRFGMKKGTPFKKETNVDKIKKTFAPKRKKKFPDLTGDGKVTFADILKGRGVINGKKKKA